MRKLIILIICILMISGCSNSENTTTSKDPTEIKLIDSTEKIDLNSIINEINARNYEWCYKTLDEEEYNSFLKITDEQKQLFTKEEIDSYRNAQSKQTVLKEEALEDIDALFKLIKYGYGPYNYLGGDEFFDSLKEEVKGNFVKGSYEYNEFCDTLIKSLSKIVDCHFEIASNALGRVSSANCDGYIVRMYAFSKDNNGFYLLDEESNKYYYETCENNSDASIQPYLAEDGTLQYRLTLLSNPNDIKKNDTLLLVDENNNEVEKQVKWSGFENCKNNGSIYYEWIGDILYIKVGNFGMGIQSDDYDTYIQSAIEARNAKYVIMDYRGNGGGNHKSTEEWIKNFTGEYSGLSYLMYYKESLLNDHFECKYSCSQHYEPNFVKNDIPVFVLMDRDSASATETSIDLLRSIENVVCVGVNTSGAFLSGSSSWINLPNSGLLVKIPADFTLRYDGINQEAVGLTPDIWCNPESCLDAVYNLLNIQ